MGKKKNRTKQPDASSTIPDEIQAKNEAIAKTTQSGGEISLPEVSIKVEN